MLLKNEFKNMHMRVHVDSPGDVNAGSALLASAYSDYEKALISFRTHYAELKTCWDPSQTDAKKLQETVDNNLGSDSSSETPLVKTGRAIQNLQTTIGQSMSALQTLIDNNVSN